MNVIKVNKGFVLPESEKEPKVMISNVRLQLHVANDEIEIVLQNVNEKKVLMKLKGEPMQEIRCSDIVYIQSVKGETGVSSNNKKVFFIHRVPGLLVDFTLSKDLKRRLKISPSDFVEIIRGIYVNKQYISKLNEKKELMVQCQNNKGKVVVKNLPISRRNFPYIQKLIDDK